MKKIKNSSHFEQLNTPIDVLLGRASMMGFVLAIGAYLTADVIAPGLV